MHPLMSITAAGIPTALQKAERYRLLNDATAAESICRDVLEIEPEHQAALIMLLLSITDQLGDRMAEGVRQARDVLPRLRDDYKRAYYAGIICERRAKAQYRQGAPGAGEMAYDWYRQAMEWYEKAEALRPAGNDEAILRWNTCARALNANPDLRPSPVEAYEPSLE